jgi:hypothetical protein
MGQPQYQGAWARCWIDLGTSDGVGLDLLINGLRQLDHEFFEIEEVLIGGLNDDWPVDREDDEDRFLPLMDQLDRLAEAEDDDDEEDDDVDDDDDDNKDDDNNNLGGGRKTAGSDGGGTDGRSGRPVTGNHRPRPGR